MSEAEIRNFCAYVETETGRSVTPCAGLEYVLINDSRTTAGLRIVSYANMKDPSRRGTKLSLYATGGRRIGANFCPICGTKLHPNADSYNENRARATTTHPQETGDGE